MIGFARIGSVGIAVVLAGCFHYVPATVDRVPPGGEVRVELTRVGFAQLPEIPNNSGPDLSGRIARADDGRLFLRVPVAIRRDGLVTQTVEQEVAIPQTEILSMERRQFSRGRTSLMVGAGLVVVGVLWSSFGSGDPPLGEQPQPPIDEEAGSGGTLSVPFASFPLF